MLEVTLIAMGNKMPTWVTDATTEFTKRLKEAFKLNLIEIPLLRRTHAHDITQILEKEAQKLEQALPKRAHVIALDAKGKQLNSEQLATYFNQLQQLTGHLCFIIGGPEGLHPRILSQANGRLSLSALTLPHPIARIVLLEALYRAWAILNNHPYHK